MSYNKLLLKHVRQLALFQFGVEGKSFFPDNCIVETSRSTGKIKRIWFNGKVLATIRPSDGMISLTLDGGLRLSKLTTGFRHKVMVDAEGETRVRNGFDVLTVNITLVDESIIPGQEVLVVNQSGELIGVGKAVLSGDEMKTLKRGTAVKIRHRL